MISEDTIYISLSFPFEERPFVPNERVATEVLVEGAAESLIGSSDSMAVISAGRDSAKGSADDLSSAACCETELDEAEHQAGDYGTELAL